MKFKDQGGNANEFLSNDHSQILEQVLQVHDELPPRSTFMARLNNFPGHTLRYSFQNKIQISNREGVEKGIAAGGQSILKQEGHPQRDQPVGVHLPHIQHAQKTCLAAQGQ